MNSNIQSSNFNISVVVHLRLIANHSELYATHRVEKRRYGTYVRRNSTRTQHTGLVFPNLKEVIHPQHSAKEEGQLFKASSSGLLQDCLLRVVG